MHHATVDHVMQIDTRLAERMKVIKPSSTLAITAKAKKLKSEGRDVVSFAAGEPDFDTPDFIKDAAIKAIHEGFTKYTPTTGIPELKEAIAAKFKKDNSLTYSSSQIIVSSGAKHSIFNALFALVNPGDEVLIPSPYWVSYPEMVALCHGQSRFIQTCAKNNFRMTTDELTQQITPRTKVLILNSPSNPTGCVYTPAELKKIAAICVKNSIFVISDEIYEKLNYGATPHVSIASLGKDIYDLTVTVNGLSKSHAMTGWRIGYLAAAPCIAEAISKFQDHSTSCPVSISQKAALATFTGGERFIVSMVAEFKKRRDAALAKLDEIQEIKAVRPEGAFYIFCDISRTRMGSVEFATRLLDEALVAVIPGDSFGRDDYMRISFATSIEQIEKGIARIKEWLAARAG